MDNTLVLDFGKYRPYMVDECKKEKDEECMAAVE